MIIGNGALGLSLSSSDILKKSKNIYIAAGISNSKIEDLSKIEREKKFIKDIIENNKEKRLIYFSTFYLNDSSSKNTLYAKNKLWIEKRILEKSGNLVLRLPNLIPKNIKSNESMTLIPYLARKIDKNEKITIYKNVKRYFLDHDTLIDVLKIAEQDNFSKIKNNCIYDVVIGKSICVKEISNFMKELLNSNVNIEEKDNNSATHQSINENFPYIKLNENYLQYMKNYIVKNL